MEQEEEEYERLEEEIKDVYRDQMTDEQFERFALDWIGEEALAYYIDSSIEEQTDIKLLKEWIKTAKTYLNFGTIEEMTDEKQLVFEPDLDFQEEDWLDVEDQAVAVVKEKFGDNYEVDNYRLEIKVVASVKKTKNTKNKGDI